MRRADNADFPASVSDVHAGSAEDDVEVHAVDTDGGIVLDAQVDVLLDAKSEVSVVGEVLATQLVFADLEQSEITFNSLLIISNNITLSKR